MINGAGYTTGHPHLRHALILPVHVLPHKFRLCGPGRDKEEARMEPRFIPANVLYPEIPLCVLQMNPLRTKTKAANGEDEEPRFTPADDMF